MQAAVSFRKPCIKRKAERLSVKCIIIPSWFKVLSGFKTFPQTDRSCLHSKMRKAIVLLVLRFRNRQDDHSVPRRSDRNTSTEARHAELERTLREEASSE